MERKPARVQGQALRLKSAHVDRFAPLPGPRDGTTAGATHLQTVPIARLIRQRPRNALGEVFLVGAGPGDPELLTLRAIRLMEEADVVVYDHLVGKEILAVLPEHVEKIYAGKEAGNHALPQDETNKLLVALARQGHKVLRLKGGDPFIFGRGGEEMAFLARHGVPFEVVPGITSASGASCYAGIPLTHRDYAQAVVYVTGHRRADGCELDWPALARARQTIVVYMGLGCVATICRKLVEHGLPANTPAAVIERATTPSQRVIESTLTDMPQDIERHGIKSPALIIIGEVVRLRAALAQDTFSSGADARHAALS